MTIPLYWDDTYRFEADATVQNILALDAGKIAIELDQTIFYPQGGGQPYDQGSIVNADAEFAVTEVRKVDGKIYHMGGFTHGTIKPGDAVHLSINPERRKLNARLHSAGHLIDIVLDRLGYSFEPIKGYHFPDGAYVEYSGEVPELDRPALARSIEAEIGKMVAENTSVKKEFVPKAELHKKVRFTMEGMPDADPVRVITLYGEIGCPCGGTHVPTTGDIGRVTIPKISCKKGVLRIRYNLDHVS